MNKENKLIEIKAIDINYNEKRYYLTDKQFKYLCLNGLW